MAISRNSGATYVIPSENEWYKAAYYNPSNSSYWLYPTQSNTAPGNAMPDTGNNANINEADPTNYLTPVGDFSASPGPFGTFDMGGDLFQWNETAVSSSYRGSRGGYWGSNSEYLVSFDRNYDNPTGEYYGVGFRVASVPEPATIALLLASAACLLGYGWRRRKIGNRALIIGVVVAAALLAVSVAEAQGTNAFNMGGTRTQRRAYGRVKRASRSSPWAIRGTRGTLP